MSQDTTEAFVYIWYDANNKKFYIGSHKGDPNGYYAHSSSVMESFSMRNIPPGYRRRVLATGTWEEMLILEAELLMNRQVVINPKYHNQHIGSPNIFLNKKAPTPNPKRRESKQAELENELKRKQKIRERDKKHKKLIEQRKLEQDVLGINFNDHEDGMLTPMDIRELQKSFKDIQWD